MATYAGLPACTCLEAWCAAFEAAIGRRVRWFQLVGDAPASANFHRGGGSADCAPLSEAELRIARNMGGAAWNRWWRDSDGDPNYHAHIRLNGCPHNTIAQPQVADLNEGRDGTGPLYDNAGVPDNGPRDGVHWPLRTWREGIDWARRQGDPTMALLTDLKRVCRVHDVSLLEAARVLLREARDRARENGKTLRVIAIRTALRALKGLN